MTLGDQSQVLIFQNKHFTNWAMSPTLNPQSSWWPSLKEVQGDGSAGKGIKATVWSLEPPRPNKEICHLTSARASWLAYHFSTQKEEQNFLLFEVWKNRKKIEIKNILKPQYYQFLHHWQHYKTQYLVHPHVSSEVTGHFSFLFSSCFCKIRTINQKWTVLWSNSNNRLAWWSTLVIPIRRQKQGGAGAQRSPHLNT